MATLPSDQDIQKARLRGQQERSSEPRATRVTFDEGTRLLTIQLATDVAISFGLAHLPELQALDADALKTIEIGPSGDSIELPSHDIQISLGGLLLELLGASGWRQTIRTELNRQAARITSEAKAAAARANGAKGGRPRKTSKG